MIAHVVDEHLSGFSVLAALDQAADAGLACVVLAERGRVGKQCLQELNRHDLAAFVLDRINPSHADVLKHSKMRQILVTEGHPKTNASQAIDVLHQRLELFVIKEVRFALPHLGEIERPRLRHRVDLHPLVVLPNSARAG